MLFRESRQEGRAHLLAVGNEAKDEGQLVKRGECQPSRNEGRTRLLMD